MCRAAGLNQLHVARVSALGFLQTYQGIDRCGERLAEEVTAYVQQHPALQRISVMGHSMGGLIARYALGDSPSCPPCSAGDPETDFSCLTVSARLSLDLILSFGISWLRTLQERVSAMLLDDSLAGLSAVQGRFMTTARGV